MPIPAESLSRHIRSLAAVAVLVASSTLAYSTEPPKQRRDQYGDPLPPQAIARLGTLRFRGVCGCLAFSPDGKCLASQTTEGGVTLWETATGRAIRRFTAPGRHLSFSADGKRLACSDNLHCHIVDVSNGNELFTVDGIHGIFAGDGKTLVTANAHCSPWRVHVWEARTGRHLRQWAAGEWIEELALASDGRTAAWINKDKPAVQIRDLESGAMKQAIPIAPNSRPQLTLTVDGKLLAIANGKKVCLWDIATGKQLRSWSQRSDSRPVFSRDGCRLAWTGYDEQMGIARIWTVQRKESAPHAVGEPINSFEPPCLSPDGKVIAVLTDGHALQLRRIRDGKKVLPLDAPDSPLGVVFTADGRHVVGECRTGVFVWETLTGRLVRRVPDAEWKDAYLTRLLPEGRLLATDRERNLVTVRDMLTGHEAWRFAARLDFDPPCFAVAPGGRYVAVHGPAGEICILDTRTGKRSYRLQLQESSQGLRLSADGEVLVCHRVKPAGIEVEVHRQTAKKSLVLRDFPKDRRLRWCLDTWYFSFLSPDGRWLVLSTEDGRLHRWDLDSGKPASPLAESLRSTWELVWSPDGRFVAAQGSALPPNVINNVIGEKEIRDVRVWELRTGKRLAHLTVPNSHGGMHVLFADDGHTMLTTDLEGVIHLWEIATGRERARLKGHLSYEIGALTLRADGRALISGGYDSQGLVWDLTGRMPDGQWRLTHHSPEQRRAYWEALASADAKAAYRAMWQLAADPDGTIAFLREQVQPIRTPQPGQIARAIVSLDSAAFAEREQATKELEKLDEIARAELRQALSQKPSLEVRRRIEALLEDLEGVPHGKRLQALRAVEVLEHIETPQARDLLRKLAEGDAAARLTQEARRALKRDEKAIAP